MRAHRRQECQVERVAVLVRGRRDPNDGSRRGRTRRQRDPHRPQVQNRDYARVYEDR